MIVKPVKESRLRIIIRLRGYSPVKGTNVWCLLDDNTTVYTCKRFMSLYASFDLLYIFLISTITWYCIVRLPPLIEFFKFRAVRDNQNSDPGRVTIIHREFKI